MMIHWVGSVQRETSEAVPLSRETCEIQGRAEPQTAALFSFWAIPQTSVKALSEMLPQRGPYTLDPASYILHPTTYILHPTPYNPHLAPYTIHIRLAF